MYILNCIFLVQNSQVLNSLYKILQWKNEQILETLHAQCLFSPENQPSQPEINFLHGRVKTGQVLDYSGAPEVTYYLLWKAAYYFIKRISFPISKRREGGLLGLRSLAVIKSIDSTTRRRNISSLKYRLVLLTPWVIHCHLAKTVRREFFLETNAELIIFWEVGRTRSIASIRSNFILGFVRKRDEGFYR